MPTFVATIALFAMSGRLPLLGGCSPTTTHANAPQAHGLRSEISIVPPGSASGGPGLGGRQFRAGVIPAHER